MKVYLRIHRNHSHKQTPTKKRTLGNSSKTSVNTNGSIFYQITRGSENKEYRFTNEISQIPQKTRKRLLDSWLIQGGYEIALSQANNILKSALSHRLLQSRSRSRGMALGYSYACVGTAPGGYGQQQTSKECVFDTHAAALAMEKPHTTTKKLTLQAEFVGIRSNSSNPKMNKACGGYRLIRNGARPRLVAVHFCATSAHLMWLSLCGKSAHASPSPPHFSW